ncbi:MAG TPA: site-specific integrase [Roseomonas sp.]
MVRRFEELHPRKRLSAIDKRALSDFKDAIARMPASSRHDIRKGSLQKAISIADAEGLPRIADVSVKRHVDAIGTLLRFAADTGYLDAAPRIRNRIARTTDDEDADRLPFSDDQLATLWAALDTVRAAPRDKRHRELSDDDWWIPRVALCSGLRVEEIAQLGKVDVRLQEGIHVFDVNTRNGKKLKSKSARRLVPVHPALIQLGFLDYVEASPGSLVFASLPTKDGRGRIAAAYSKRFAALLRKKAKITDERLVFHSLRHTYATKARAAGIGEEELGRLLGHSPGASVTARYGKGPGVQQLAELVRRIPIHALR